MELDEGFAIAAAPNSGAAQNGRVLAIKKKFTSLHISEDATLLFGYCQGSGRTPYFCSADFGTPDKPVYRCSCPSRQFPCKHCVGLLFAKALKQNFVVAAVPEDLKSKRDKAAANSEKKKAASTKPRSVNKSALVKKIQAQLNGLDLLERLLRDVVRLGIGNMNAKTALEMEDQARQLGDQFLPGAQAALRSYTRLFKNDCGDDLPTSGREAVFSEAFDQLGRLHSLIGKGRSYLRARLEDPELTAETETAIAAWLGHAWQLRELVEAGLVDRDVELIQLSFQTQDDPARQEIVDTGVWMNLGNGNIHLTQNYRPYRSLKHVKSDDSFFQIAIVKELCRYPGNWNSRIRWDGMLTRPVELADLKQVAKYAKHDYLPLVKEIKGHIKAPLADKHPIVAIHVSRAGKVGDEFVFEDATGARLVLSDRGWVDEPRSSYLLQLMPQRMLQEQVFVVRFRNDLDAKRLFVKPLAIVTASEVIRLTL
ncbi:MAG: SWIM zinc finger family protein [Planctomycetales bacterium]|nr:SWIM zinc finger family protein [Planctomycetales bacterium]